MNTQEMAFPSVVPDDSEGVVYHNLGCTMRDYFAAKAMQGICADPSVISLTAKIMAKISYEVADAMLAERDKGE